MEHKFSFNVNMYRSPPVGSENLMDLVEMANERLKLYKILQSNESISLTELRELLKDSPLSPLVQKHSPPLQKLQARKLDDHSHWILRTAYCKNPNLFIKYEKQWFRMRFSCMKNIEKKKFLEKNNLQISPVSDAEKAKLNIDMKECFRVKYIRVPSLLPSRQYPLVDGYMYLPPEETIVWVLNDFEKHLKASLTHMSKLPSLDDQLQTIVSFLDLVKPPVIKYIPLESVAPENLDEEAVTNFPLCMRFQHETLRKTHHLKYFSRMQYGLFLKGLGLTLEETLQFWKEEFLHDMPEHKFMGKYSYLFRHHYGTVGSRIDHAPYSCQKIFGESVGANQIHGCPYKNWEGSGLKNKLTEYGFPPSEVREIVDLAGEKKYSAACSKYFEYCTGRRLDEPITHPNQYYCKSCQLGKDGGDMEDLFLSDSE